MSKQGAKLEARKDKFEKYATDGNTLRNPKQREWYLNEVEVDEDSLIERPQGAWGHLVDVISHFVPEDYREELIGSFLEDARKVEPTWKRRIVAVFKVVMIVKAGFTIRYQDILLHFKKKSAK